MLRIAPERTLGHSLARLHLPLMTGLSIANLIADNFAGFTGVGQLAPWSARLVRAVHLAADRRAGVRESSG